MEGFRVVWKSAVSYFFKLRHWLTSRLVWHQKRTNYFTTKFAFIFCQYWRKYCSDLLWQVAIKVLNPSCWMWQQKTASEKKKNTFHLVMKALREGDTDRQTEKEREFEGRGLCFRAWQYKTMWRPWCYNHKKKCVDNSECIYSQSLDIMWSKP